MERQNKYETRVQSVSHKIKENTEKIRSILRTSILRLFLGPLVVLPKVHTELLSISKEWRDSVSLSTVSCFFLPTFLQSYVAHTYVRTGTKERRRSNGTGSDFILSLCIHMTTRLDVNCTVQLVIKNIYTKRHN
jgi:hypothetical protein